MVNPPLSDDSVPGDTPHHSHEPRLEARWERPFVAVRGGEATLLVHIVAPAMDEIPRGAPLDIAFVLDRSGSMRGDKLALAREGVDLAAAKMDDHDRIALVIYDDDVDLLQPLQPATPRVKASLRLALQGVDAGGSTFLSGGWTRGCQELAHAAAPEAGAGRTRLRRTILLTDGLANIGVIDPRELTRDAGELRRRGIATTTVGVGADFDEGLLSAMAEAGGGNFAYVANPRELREFFASEVQELFRVVAAGLTVVITLPDGVTAELVSAFPVEAGDGTLRVAVGDLAAGDEIDLVFQVRAQAGTMGETLPVAVTVEWTDPGADARREEDVSLPRLRRAAAAGIAAIPADPLVAERAALQRAAAERRAALELDRAGRFEDSRAHMMASMMLLEMAPETNAVREDLAMSRRLAAAPFTTPYASHQRKMAQHREDLHRRGRRHLDRDHDLEHDHEQEPEPNRPGRDA